MSFLKFFEIIFKWLDIHLYGDEAMYSLKINVFLNLFKKYLKSWSNCYIIWRQYFFYSWIYFW